MSNFKKCMMPDDINKAYFEFVNTVNYGINVNCPLKCKKQQPNKKSWLSPNIIKKGQEIKQLFHSIKTINDPQLHDFYKKQKKDYNKLLETSKQQHNSQMIEQSENKQKVIWSIYEIKFRKNKTRLANNIKCR